MPDACTQWLTHIHLHWGFKNWPGLFLCCILYRVIKPYVRFLCLFCVIVSFSSLVHIAMSCFCCIVFSALTLLFWHNKEHLYCRNWAMICWLAWLSTWNKVCVICIRSCWWHCHPSSSASFKNLEGLHFWYQPIHVVLNKMIKGIYDPMCIPCVEFRELSEDLIRTRGKR